MRWRACKIAGTWSINAIHWHCYVATSSTPSWSIISFPAYDLSPSKFSVNFPLLFFFVVLLYIIFLEIVHQDRLPNFAFGEQVKIAINIPWPLAPWPLSTFPLALWPLPLGPSFTMMLRTIMQSFRSYPEAQFQQGVTRDYGQLWPALFPKPFTLHEFEYGIWLSWQCSVYKIQIPRKAKCVKRNKLFIWVFMTF